jgi:tRNA threonylcarbamoyladenosine biosynthesis protein TsaE
MDSKFTLDQLDVAASRLIEQVGSHRVLAFHGEMGAGKTTFIQAICRSLQVVDVTSSPTFSIINQYKTEKGEAVYHMDLYRLRSDQEAVMAGVEDCLHSGNWCLVEWPEKAPGIFPPATLHCYIEASSNNERKLQIKL